MSNANEKVYLYVHIIWIVDKQEAVLKKPILNLLLIHIKKIAEEKFLKIHNINGVANHLHCLLQLHPTQSLSHAVKIFKEESATWLNENKFLENNFEWSEGYAAYSVSPSSVKQVADYINKQEEHHKTKTLESELEVFEKIQI
jgi:REP-associated tyrosine transposase